MAMPVFVLPLTFPPSSYFRSPQRITLHIDLAEVLSQMPFLTQPSPPGFEWALGKFSQFNAIYRFELFDLLLIQLSIYHIVTGFNGLIFPTGQTEQPNISHLLDLL